MKALYFNGKEAIYREDMPKPEEGGGRSLIRITFAAVCTTDKEILKGYRPDFKGIMGHEFVGVVENSDRPELIGKRVVGEINEVCGECLYCRTGRPHHCSNRTTPGLSKDGCFAEYMTLKTENLHVVPDGLKDELAVFTEPLAAAFEIFEQIEAKPGEPALVLGDGRLALCAAQALKIKGYDVTVLGRHAEKLALFRGFASPVTKADPEAYELVVEATGNPAGISQALQLVRKKGTIVLKSTYAENATINLSLVPVNEITIVGSRCGPFEPALEALASGKVILPEIELYELKDWQEAFASPAFKAGFRF